MKQIGMEHVLWYVLSVNPHPLLDALDRLLRLVGRSPHGLCQLLKPMAHEQANEQLG